MSLLTGITKKHHATRHFTPPCHPQTRFVALCCMRPNDCRHLNSTRRPLCVYVWVCNPTECLCFTGVQSPVFSPNENLAAEAVKPGTRYLVFKSFLALLSARARPFMALPLLSVIKANLKPLIIPLPPPPSENNFTGFSIVAFEDAKLVFSAKLFFACFNGHPSVQCFLLVC